MVICGTFQHLSLNFCRLFCFGVFFFQFGINDSCHSFHVSFFILSTFSFFLNWRIVCGRTFCSKFNFHVISSLGCVFCAFVNILFTFSLHIKFLFLFLFFIFSVIPSTVEKCFLWRFKDKVKKMFDWEGMILCSKVKRISFVNILYAFALFITFSGNVALFSIWFRKRAIEGNKITPQ